MDKSARISGLSGSKGGRPPQLAASLIARIVIYPPLVFLLLALDFGTPLGLPKQEFQVTGQIPAALARGSSGNGGGCLKMIAAPT